MKKRLEILRALSVAFVCGSTATAGQAQPAGYPNRMIELIVPYSAGGGVSAMARAFAAEASKESGQQWVVATREGAGGVVGFASLARARPDGYSIVFSPASPMTNAPFLNSHIPFKNSEIQPVCQIFENVFAVATRKESEIRTFPELIQKAKATPGALSYGHSGPGTVGHLSMATVERTLNVSFNAIAYRGDAPLLTDAMGGTLDFAAPAISSLAGKDLRVLAVLSSRRHPSLPNTPAISEFGVNGITPGLNGLFVPAGTPRPIVDRLEKICQKVTASSIFGESAKGLMQVPQFLDSSRFKDRIDNAYKVNETLVPGLKLEKI